MNMLTLDEIKYKNVEVDGYKFKIKYIAPMDKIEIAERRGRIQGTKPIESLTDVEFVLFQSIATIDTCVDHDDLPKELQQYPSSSGWPIESLILSLADEIIKHTTDVQEKLKKNRSTC